MTPSRREVLRTAGLATTGLGAAGLVGCSKGGEKITPGPTTAKAADIPVGSGKVIEGTNFVVTQPTAGKFCAFTRLCPHAGCTVNRVQDRDIVCPCHGSEFSVVDGSVTRGPATSGLGRATVTVKGDSLNISA